MILLAVNDVTKHFGPEPVLAGVSFEVRPGERIGLVGPNGTGKSTLLKILIGREDAQGGDVTPHATARVEMLEQQPDFAPGQTVWDEAARGLADLTNLSREAEQVAALLAETSDPAEHDRLAARFDRLQTELHRRDGYVIDHRIERVLDGLGFARASFRQPVAQLSGGQQNRLLLARTLLTAPDVMLLDEPSNHLDIEATEWLEEYLRGCPHAIILVSHDRYFLDRVTNRTLELFHGTVESYTGGYTAYRRQQQERIVVARRTFELQQQEIARLEDFVRRNKYGQKHAQAEDRRKRLERMERVDPPREIPTPTFAFPEVTRSGDIVLRVEHLSKAYDAPLIDDLSFDVLRGQRWGIVGPNGSGKSTLLGCLVGDVAPDAGNVIIGTGVEMAYYDQHLRLLDDDTETVEAVHPGVGDCTLQQRRDLLGRFGITGDMVFQRVSTLSGGERSRAALARLAATAANLLILDEPTNHLDLWAREALETALRKFQGTLIFVSHDRYFLNRMADHLLVWEADRWRVIEGNYDTYHALAEARRIGGAPPQRDTGNDRAAQASAAKKPSAAKSTNDKSSSGKATSGKASSDTRRKRRFPYRKVADIEADIFDREQRLEELHAAFAEPDTHRDGDRVRGIQREIDQLKDALAELYEHWEEASELN
ncbi:MAG: ABC-F family ATP-binding cassette domain-containing protein [Planctomycetales bacterium]|nr:ABC-F family ATP-binding cassette domain-containing protein [Planctomycetales bacterium]